MDIETKLKFINAGYTKEDIEKLETASTDESGRTESADNGSDNETKGKVENSERSENAGAVAPEIEATLKSLTETVNGLTETVKAMQNLNIKGASTESTDKKGVDEVMKSFIESL